MLEKILTARETALITTALTLAAFDWPEPKKQEALSLRNEIINAWVAQNPDAYDIPWEKPL